MTPRVRLVRDNNFHRATGGTFSVPSALSLAATMSSERIGRNQKVTHSRHSVSGVARDSARVSEHMCCESVSAKPDFLWSAPVAFRRVALETPEWTSRDSNHHRQSVSAGKTNAIPTEPSGRLCFSQAGGQSYGQHVQRPPNGSGERDSGSPKAVLFVFHRCPSTAPAEKTTFCLDHNCIVSCC